MILDSVKKRFESVVRSTGFSRIEAEFRLKAGLQTEIGPELDAVEPYA